MTTNERKVAEENFLHGLNSAITASVETGFIAPIRFTVLADLMQIQCLKSNNTDLLEFTLPRGINDIVTDIANSTDAKLTFINTDEQDCFGIKFESEGDQDKFIQLFEMMSFQGKRAYATPDIYLGKPNVDQQFCIYLIGLLIEIVKDDFGRKISSQKNLDSNAVNKVQCGAIFYQARVDESDFFAPPKFEQLDQQTRCYLVEYSNGFSRFFWSKPGEYGDTGMFITEPVVENEPRNGERYFNDAYHEDPNEFTLTLTMTNQRLHDGQAFMYRQKFSNWMGAFMGNLNSMQLSNVPDAWMRIFQKNAPKNSPHND